jgi:nicotinate-nucleotide adenylyltransferase
MSERLGLLGGTFDPIHNGHLRSAEEIWEDFRLDRVLFIPAYLPPHKEEGQVSSFEHRLAMCALAVEGNPHFGVTDLERTREGPSYSIDTVRDIQGRFPEAELHFILGRDAFLGIPAWGEYRELFSLAHFIVMTRPGYSRGAVTKVLEQVSSRFRHDPRSSRYIHPSGRFVHFWETTLLDISSTRIRQYFREGMSTRYLLPEAVADYVRRHELFK